jgi:hypothetical protein
MATLEIDAIRQVQAQFDEALSRVGMRAPAPIANQTPVEYLQDACQAVKRKVLPRGHPFRTVQYDELGRKALEALVPQLLQACVKEVRNPDNLEPGEIRPIEVRGPDGQKWIDWVGREHFTKLMGRPGRRVVSFTTSNGRYDAVKGRYF